MSAYEELIKAVHDKSCEFNVHLHKVQKLSEALATRSAEVLVAVHDMIGAVRPHKKEKCAVCYTRDRAVAFVPCGHVFCPSCADRGQRANRCFTCRQPVDEKIRVYI